MTTNVSLSGTPAGRGSLLFESEPIYVVSFYLITRHNSLIITEGWLSPTGHQPNISWSLGLLLLLSLLLLLLLIIIIIVVVIIIIIIIIFPFS